MASSNDPPRFPMMRELDTVYEKLAKIGQGTYGEVFKARNRITKEFVAQKRILMENETEGFPIAALREIDTLKKARHENVVNLIEVCRTKPPAGSLRAQFVLILEYCESDLTDLLANRDVKLKPGEIKSLLKQLFSGMHYLHSNNILHRDIKSCNILITKQGVLKVADFGLARAHNATDDRPNSYTNLVVTLWYRPPELLLGERNYGPSVDMWGVGCVMAEMWIRTVLWPGSSEQHQLTLITNLCGSISPANWPKVTELPLYRALRLEQNKMRRVKDKLRPFVRDSHGLDLLDKLLCLDPKRRLDAKGSLDHSYFHNGPKPCETKHIISRLETSTLHLSRQRQRPQQGPKGQYCEPTY